MGVYSRYVLPRLIAWACSSRHLAGERERVVPLARGKVLEIGIGSGNSLEHYDPELVTHLTGLDPSLLLWKRRRNGSEKLGFEVEFMEAKAERIPYPDDTFDTVVSTFTLCSVESPLESLREMYRVLKPGGICLIAEHGLSPDSGLQQYQFRLNPFWRRISGGCNLNRDMKVLLKEAGFDAALVEGARVDGWKATSYHFVGAAAKPLLVIK